MWWDSYPYSSLSVFVLYPLYLRVQALSQKIPEEIKQAREHLNLKDVYYEATMATKLAIAKNIFYLEKDEVLNSDAFQKFFQENKAWLEPYAEFCFLRDLFLRHRIIVNGVASLNSPKQSWKSWCQSRVRVTTQLHFIFMYNSIYICSFQKRRNMLETTK